MAEGIGSPRQKSWPLAKKLSPAVIDGLRRNKSLRFADTEGLPLVTIFNIRRADSCESLSSLSSNSSSINDVSSTVSGPAASWQRKRLPASKLFSEFLSGLPASSSSSSSDCPSTVDRRLRFVQRQPSSLPDFHRSLQRNLISVENVAIRAMTVFAIVRVRNIAYEKHVAVRYTMDSWSTSKDIQASYVDGSCDGPTDRFSFTVLVGDDFPVGGKVEFAVYFRASGAEFWDNNGGENFSVTCEQR
ncbi:glycogen-binding subunit 76A-like [Sycon ciliatum]|uniref:glycogen-binding subunit 76A-like n=1 Tax=Sycon ciliatum TaxID=27933 RepID=UPI0031F62EFA